MSTQIDWSAHEALTTDKPHLVAGRLRKLAKHLRTIPRKRFDQGSWGREESCGTVAGLAGHACAVFPEKLRLKFELTPNEDGSRCGTVRRVLPSGRLAGGSRFTDQQFAMALGLDEMASYELTAWDAPHQTPKAAAKACERLADEIDRRGEAKAKP